MAGLIASSEIDVVVGMGATGFSIARHLQRQGRQFVMLDTRQTPPQLERFQKEFPQVRYELGALTKTSFMGASRVIVSPGISTHSEPFENARIAGLSVIGDIQLFVDAANEPIIAITGSNAKSTVTTLVGEMIKAAGLNAAVGGNLGIPALDLLETKNVVDFFVLELSSFQLEVTNSVKAEVATVLNVSEDHMDRYGTLQAYHSAKQRIYFGAKQVVINREDVLTQPPINNVAKVTSFGLNKPDLKDFGLIEEDGVAYLAHGLRQLMPLREVKLPGRHNAANALAALAIGNAIQLPLEAMLDTLRSFGGLSHRCQWVRQLEGVEYFNDSKGTNVGATVAAINGLAREPGKLVLIAGGEGKGADFSLLRDAVAKHLRAAILIGEDAQLIATVIHSAGIATFYATDMEEAVEKARNEALEGDAVLLSPACASFDMFNNYEHRGQVFMDAVLALQ